MNEIVDEILSLLGLAASAVGGGSMSWALSAAGVNPYVRLVVSLTVFAVLLRVGWSLTRGASSISARCGPTGCGRPRNCRPTGCGRRRDSRPQSTSSNFAWPAYAKTALIVAASACDVAGERRDVGGSPDARLGSERIQPSGSPHGANRCRQPLAPSPSWTTNHA